MTGRTAVTHPGEIRTERLHLRPWRPADADRLLPVLEANIAHLSGWIPPSVALPAPLPELANRLAGFAADFEAARSWRYGIFSKEGEVLGEASLFFRSASERVPLTSADRLEIGYWLRSDATGRGFATEAARAMLSLGAGLSGMRHVEIRCDAGNESSIAVARRLGFRVVQPQGTAPDSAESPDIMIWIHELEPEA
jgi:RimJ/RimL family protein N-acetyltransferase